MKARSSFFIIVLTALSYRSAAQMAGFDSLYARANQDRNTGAFAKAIAGYQQCLVIATNTNTKDSLRMGNSLIGIGIANDQGGQFEEALLYYFKALDIYERIGNQKKAGGALKNIGNTYRVLKDYNKASSFLQQALALQYARKDSASIGNVLNDIGLVCMDQDSAATALTWFNTILTGYDKYLRDEVKSYVLNNLALALTQLKRYPEALNAYQSSLSLMKKRDDQYGIALVLGNIGDLYYKTHDLPRALELHLQNLAIVQGIKSNELLKDSYDNLAKTYQGLGDYKKAYSYQQDEMKLKDTIYKEQSARSYAEMEARYQNEKKQKEILYLQQNNKIANIQLLNQRLIKYCLLAGLAIILLIVLFLYRNYRAKQKINKELNHINNKLEEANNSKTKLISIISHDLRSPVSSLFSFLELKKQHSGRMKKEEQEQFDKELTRSSENLLEAMEDLLIWSKSQMDHFTLAGEKISVNDLMDEMILLHRPFADEKNVLLKKEGQTDFLFQTDPNFIKVILRNLVTNAIKFTPMGGVITLSGIREKDHILLSVKDTGAGIARADLGNIFDWTSIRSDSSGLGLKLARDFAEKLGGRLSVQSEPGKGSEFILTLPA
jgi:signal transduction histidine kinase